MSVYEAWVWKLVDWIWVVVVETLETWVKDLRLGFVTITDARVTGDLREATVFYTVYGDEAARADTAAALASARGVLRSEVGRQTGVRYTPTLEFVADRSTYKQGRSMPGVGVPIVGPESLGARMPDYTLLLTWNFADEILAQQADYRRAGGQFIIPIPEPRIA